MFSEVYSAYYAAIAAILEKALKGDLTDRDITRIVRERAFGESVLTIPAALRSGEWPLLGPGLTTPLRHRPRMPLTELERRWLKALLLDPRIALFDPSDRGLEDVEPLWRPGDVVYFDRYADSDPYGDPGYAERFRLILRALREHRRLEVRFRGRLGRVVTVECTPLRLEYSAKDDKLRLIALEGGRTVTVNLGRVLECTVLDGFDPGEVTEPPVERKIVTFLLRDRRRALERVMLHFSDLEKVTERLEGDLYRVTLRYDRADETEILIRILSFGPMVRVTGPEEFVGMVRERLERQGPV